MKLPLWAIALLLLLAVLTGTWLIRRERRMQSESPAVLLQIRQLKQLATVKYTVQKVVGLTDQKQPVGTESILLIIQASVEAGIDLSSMSEADISRRRDDTVAIRIPPARILNVMVEEKGTKVWDRQKTWWTPWEPYSLTLEQRAREQGLEAAKQSALSMGILTQAEASAKAAIQGLLALAGIKAEVMIKKSGSLSWQGSPSLAHENAPA
jgi:hypothetical protein